MLQTTSADPTANDRERICGQYLVRTDTDLLQLGHPHSSVVVDLLGPRPAGTVWRTIVLAADGLLWWPRASKLQLLAVGEWDGEFRYRQVG